MIFENDSVFDVLVTARKNKSVNNTNMLSYYSYLHIQNTFHISRSNLNSILVSSDSLEIYLFLQMLNVLLLTLQVGTRVIFSCSTVVFFRDFFVVNSYQMLQNLKHQRG